MPAKRTKRQAAVGGERPLDGFLHVERELSKPLPVTRRTPRIGAAAIITDGERVVLGQRGKEPMRGKWVLPGGGIEFGETFTEALAREMREELGLEISIDGFASAQEIVRLPDEHRIVLYFAAHVLAGQLKASSDLLDARWFTREEVHAHSESGVVTETVVRVLRETGWL